MKLCIPNKINSLEPLFYKSYKNIIVDYIILYHILNKCCTIVVAEVYANKTL